METLIYIYIFIIGLALGSFVNAWVYRIYKTEFAPKKERKKMSVATGRSACVHCGHELSVSDLVPVASWLVLKGKCRYCHKPIARQYPAVELAGGILAVISLVFWPYGLGLYGGSLLAVWLGIVTIVLALTVADLRWMLLPTSLVKPMFLLAALWVGVQMTQEPTAIIGSIVGLLTLGGLFHLIFIVSDGKWIGGGDVRVGYAIGLIVGGLLQAVLVLFISSLLGLIYILLISIKHKVKKSDHIPFGPSLLTAMIIVVLLEPVFDAIFTQFLLF